MDLQIVNYFMQDRIKVAPRLFSSSLTLTQSYGPWWEGVGPWKSRLIWGQMALASLVAISGPKKVSISRAQFARCHFRQKRSRFSGPIPLPLALVMDLHALKTLCTGPYKS
jgi:hypothetical protein